MRNAIRLTGILLCAALMAGFMRGGVAVPPPAVSFSHVPLGGTGAVINVSSVPSAGLLLANTDQFGCYKSVSNGQWQQLVTVASMPNDGIGAVTTAGAPLANGSGQCIPDPSNANNLWMETNGSLYKSTNQGASWSTTTYPAQSPTASQGQSQNIKGMGRTIAVDPNNGLVVYASTPSAGLQRSIDGSTFSLISTASIPLPTGLPLGGGAATSGGHLIAFDTSGGTTTVSGQTRTAIVYATSYGRGLYKSTDGGQTWTIQNSSGMPTTFWYMDTDNLGNVWLLDDSDSNGQAGVPFKYNGTNAWTALSGTLGTTYVAVAVDHSNCASAGACHIAFMGTGGNTTGTAYTVNGGGAWTVARGTKTFTTTDVPWINNWIVGFGLFASGAAWDASGHLYTGGEGAYFMTPPTSGTAISITSQTKGIEEGLIGAVVTSPTMSGSLAIATWDVNCFTMTAPYNTLPGNSNRGCGSTNGTSLQRTNMIDWAASSPSTLVALTDNQARGGGYVNFSAISTDGGVTWPTALQAPSSVTSNGYIEGCIAASTPTNILWAPTDGSGGGVAPLFTTNAGAAATYTSISTSATGGWPWASFLTSKTCAADRVAANTFYQFNWNPGTGNPAFYKCTASGGTCVQQSTGALPAATQFIPTFKHVPNIGSGVASGHLFFSYAISTPYADDTNYGFYYSTDGFATKTQITGWTMVAAFGFGAPADGGTYPSILAVGFYNHVWGIYKSTDWATAKTWTKVGDYPMGLPVTIADIDGDKTIPNVWFYGTNSGVFCSSPSASNCGNTF